MIIKAIVTTLDNLDNLKESLPVLRSEPLDEIIIVNNGSIDGTREWLDKQSGILTVNRENLGAGPGRNAGLDAAGEFDYVLMIDGGIRPLHLGTKQMLDYLQRTPEADVIGVEIPDFETDREKAWRRWPDPIERAYPNTRLSHTAYCLARYKAFDGLRFCEEGPFGQPGWGADDDEMRYQWLEAGINVHVVTGVHPYRRASGSFRRLYQETGVWPNQYGSVYEQRVVWLMHNWPQYEPIGMWGEPWLTVVIVPGDDIDETAIMIKTAHDVLRQRRFEPPYDKSYNPYSIVLWCKDYEHPVWKWAEPRHLRQHHGDTILNGRRIVRRGPENESTWTGDFRLYDGAGLTGAIRPGAFYYGLAANPGQLERLISVYNNIHPLGRTKADAPVGGDFPRRLCLKRGR